jgi:hypothetical protein
LLRLEKLREGGATETETANTKKIATGKTVTKPGTCFSGYG